MFKETKSFQLIDADAQIIANAKDKFSNEQLNNKGKQYYTMGIIGAQSSGKSTLMNHLFDTDFQVMESQKRGQTTKGIWVAHQNDHNVIYFNYPIYKGHIF